VAELGELKANKAGFVKEVKNVEKKLHVRGFSAFLLDSFLMVPIFVGHSSSRSGPPRESDRVSPENGRSESIAGREHVSEQGSREFNEAWSCRADHRIPCKR
jgi:hypothetical protein